ncbi:type II toxin-antitoxin system VapB family antitoxin [Klebsiella pneumoniae]|uniref:type II toxin-antitoxin system VapB family antitoxin n=1 Tax=Klebsiella pneumoniae TaxID=573 RepID=UPI0032DBA9A4
MKQCSVIQTEHGQAVVLPEDVAFPEHVLQVDVVAIGRTRIITPAGDTWESWFAGAGVTADALADRDQPEDQERDTFD